MSKVNEREIKLHSTMDASIWAKEFMKVIRDPRDGALLCDIDESFMLSWFANAIMVGWDHAMQSNWEKLNREKLNKGKSDEEK